MADNKSLTADLACMRPIVDVRRRFGLSLSCVAGATARMFLDQEPHFGLHKRKRSRQHCVSTGAGDFFIPNSYTRGPLIIRSAAFFTYSASACGEKDIVRRWIAILAHVSVSTSGARGDGIGRSTASIRALRVAARSISAAASSGLLVDLAYLSSADAWRAK